MKTIISLVAALVLSACASVGELALTAGTTGAVRFGSEDVDAAIVIAQQTKDTAAEACYRAIRKHTDAPASLVTRGIVSTYAAARAKTREARAGLAEEVHGSCAPLVLDSAEFARSFGLKLRGAIQ